MGSQTSNLMYDLIRYEDIPLWNTRDCLVIMNNVQLTQMLTSLLKYVCIMYPSPALRLPFLVTKFQAIHYSMCDTPYSPYDTHILTRLFTETLERPRTV